MSQKPKYAIGIDLGGTAVKGVVLQDDGRILARSSRELDFGTSDTSDDLHWCTASLYLVKSFHEKYLKTAGIGISAPGLTDPDNSSIAYMPGRFPGLEGFRWGEHLSDPVVVMNDAKAALMAEYAYGAGKGSGNMILLTLGTGVGGAIMIDHKILNGKYSRAGHLGHISIDPDRPAGILSLPGTLEVAIGNATVAERSGGAYQNTIEMLREFEKGDKHAREVWMRSIRDLGRALCSFTNILSPDLIILGGGITRAGKALFDPLRQVMDEYEWRPTGEATPIVQAHYEELAGAVGAAAAVLQKQEILNR